MKCSYKQAWILRSGSLRLFNSKNSFIRIGISLNQGAKHWEEGVAYIAMYVSCIEKWQAISTSQSLSGTFVLVFYAQYLIFWEQCLKEIHVILGNQSRSMLYFMVIIEENPASHREVFWKGIITSKALFDSVGNSSPNPYQNLEESQLQDMYLDESIV